MDDDRGIEIGHGTEESDVEEVELEDRWVFVGADGMSWFREATHLVDEACVAEPLDCRIEFPSTCPLADVAQDEAGILFGQLPGNAGPHLGNAAAGGRVGVLGEVLDVSSDDGSLDGPNLGERSTDAEAVDGFGHSTDEEVLAEEFGEPLREWRDQAPVQ